ncbi:MAG: TonB-dependent receptor, partial [Thermodesulfobacteriota bacterium]
VLIDGRTVYSSLFNGVYWNRIDTLLHDIERIEVIRGPGGSLWGTNAAKGIVNIVTRSSLDTSGGYLSVGGGDGRYGHGLEGRYGLAGESRGIRFYAKQYELDRGTYPDVEEQSAAGVFVAGKTAYDGQTMGQGGFRSDFSLGSETRMTFQGDIYRGEEEFETVTRLPLSAHQDDIDSEGGNLLGRIDHSFNDESSIKLQLYYDYTAHQNATFEDRRNIFDIDFQHNLFWTQHELVWGLGYRQTENRTSHDGGTYTFALDPEERSDSLLSFFIQDEFIFLEEQARFIIGSKYEYNDYTGSEWQPSMKLLYAPDSRQNFRFSVSRAVVVPSRALNDAYLDLNSFSSQCEEMGGESHETLGCIRSINDRDADSTNILSWEGGYRHQLQENWFFDGVLFYDDYREANSESELLESIWGFEGLVQYHGKPFHGELSYTYHQGESAPEAGEKDVAGQIPRHSVKGRIYYSFFEDFDLDVLATYVDGVVDLSSVFKVDLRLAWHPKEDMELSLKVNNLIGDDHVEGNWDILKANTLEEREFIARLSYRF